MTPTSIWTNPTFNLALIRLGIILLAISVPMITTHVGLIAATSPLLAVYLVYAVIASVSAIRPKGVEAEWLLASFPDAALIGAILITQPSLPLLLTMPLLMLGLVWTLPPKTHRQAISLLLLSALLAWVSSQWFLSPGPQIMVTLYLAAGALFAFRFSSTQLNGRTDAGPVIEGPTPTDSKAPGALAAVDADRHQDTAGVVLLRGQSNDSADLPQLVRGWESTLHVASDLVELISVAHRASETLAPKAVIVDHRGRSEDPVQLAHLFRSNPSLTGLRLLLVTTVQPCTSTHSLLSTVYDVVLNTPLDRTLLFNELERKGSGQQSNGVASLLDHYLRARSPLPSLEILLAMPSQMQLKANRRLLEREGHQVYATGSAEHALDALTAQRFDLALVHRDLTDMDALELTRIHSLTKPNTGGTPIVIVAADFSAEARQHCLQAGAQSTLTLPLQLASLRDLHRHLLAREPATAPPSLTSGKLRTDKTVPQLDRDVLSDLEELGNGLNFIEELIDAFVIDSNEMLSDAVTATLLRDLETFRDCVHALRGSAGSLGAARLQRYCTRVTAVGPVDLQENISRLLQQLHTTVHDAQGALLDYVHKRREQVLGD